MSQKIVILFTYKHFVPLTNSVIIKLNEITTLVEDKQKITNKEAEEIKKIFYELLKNGEIYDVDDIESWLENEGSWPEKSTRVRVTNISHYVQDKYQQSSKFRLILDDDSCSCGS